MGPGCNFKNMTWPHAFSEDRQLNVIIEAPCKSRNKFRYDEVSGLFKLRKVLPPGLYFPCDMGFIPNTKGEDGDPLDALIFMDEITYPGCLVECRLLGVIRGRQKNPKEDWQQNDRFICVPSVMKEYDHLKEITDINKHKLDAIITFFQVYNAFYKTVFAAGRLTGSKQAAKMIKNQLI